MLDLLVVILFGWLFVKCAGIMLHLAWGTMKIAAIILMAIALPALVVCLIFAGGILLLLPIIPIAVAYLLIRAL